MNFLGLQRNIFIILNLDEYVFSTNYVFLIFGFVYLSNIVVLRVLIKCVILMTVVVF